MASEAADALSIFGLDSSDRPRDKDAGDETSESSSGRRKVLFTPNKGEFKRAVCLFVRASDGKLWEEDLELLLRLAYGADVRHAFGWRAYEWSSMVDDGLISLRAVLDWIDRGGIDHLLEAGSCARPSSSKTQNHTSSSKTPTSSSKTQTPTSASSRASAPAGGVGGGAAPPEPPSGDSPLAKTSSSFSSLCELIETFNQFDCDNNGVICAKDLKHALSKLTGDDPSLQECKKMIQRVDGNYDGVVDLSEFVEMMKGPRGLGRRATRH